MEKQCGVIWLGDRNRRNAQPIKYEVLHSGCYKVVGRELDSRGCYQVRANGSQKIAHRAVWKHFNGEIPDGLIICHKCDFGGCVNIQRMELGTIADNNRQRYERGRHRVIRYFERK
ncbi:HNH endonuclease signature motif containing protein [Paenactinomyces guangxiensis]|uniref:HNH endonuclease n=1 Tax=Paenactinomyces guangxiensis TaxID=1490290 RepID=A0A7W2A9U2_9BACL|nr:HNH endonuclease [Paenactinomyces guangxiensis]MBH8592342.1 HNH endonuclease [Paenactinomyces guangxiensis]